MIFLKTDSSYNEADFVEENQTMRELTVTITLEEYRSLIHDDAVMTKEIVRLQDENRELKKVIESMWSLIKAKAPDLIRWIGSLLMDFGKEEESSDKETEADE